MKISIGFGFGENNNDSGHYTRAGSTTNKGTLELCGRWFSWTTRDAITCSAGRNTQKEMGGINKFGYGKRSSDSDQIGFNHH